MEFKVQVTKCVDYFYDVVVDAPDLFQAAVKAEQLVENGTVQPIGNNTSGVFATNAKEIEVDKENEQPVQKEVSKEN